MVPCAINVETDKKMRARKAERVQLRQALQAANAKSQPLIDLQKSVTLSGVSRTDILANSDRSK